MILYIVRHAWAGDAGDPRYPDDRQRPLTDEGRKRFGRVVKKLIRRGFNPALVASSPLVRCRQTAEVISQRVPGGPQIVLRSELAPGSDLDGLLAWTAEQAVPSLAWVGHAPDVGCLAAALVGDGRAALHFAKGSVAALKFEDRPAPGGGELLWLMSAKELNC
jgi:phosphohistidine phosphatase